MMNEQQRLLMLIWSNDATLIAQSGVDSRGLAIYKRNLLANAQRALRITFPTIFALLDSDVSENLVRQFLVLCPPNQGDWGQWGEEFVDFIAVNQLAQDYAYLPDCAQLDWLAHCALHGKDDTLDQHSLQLLANTDPDQLQIMFNNNMSIIESPYPIKDIYDAHHHSEEAQRKLAMQRAQDALATVGNAHHVMLYRPQFEPKIRLLSATDAVFTQLLLEGNTLSSALDALKKAPLFSFEKWLLTAIENNIIKTIIIKTE